MTSLPHRVAFNVPFTSEVPSKIRRLSNLHAASYCNENAEKMSEILFPGDADILYVQSALFGYLPEMTGDVIIPPVPPNAPPHPIREIHSDLPACVA